MNNNIPPKMSIAPMIDWTYTHFRVWMRLLAPKALLYTEMQTCGAIQYNRERALSFDPIEHPLALQLGGSDKQALAEAAVLAEKEGYDEINLNLGCPSDKVQAGHFGACLMMNPKLVAECIQAMKQSIALPVTAKTRIGIDNEDSYEFFRSFVYQLVEAGADKIIVHARKAWLNGLNPKQNRTIPPVNYDYVYRIKQELPEIPIWINGNITSLEATKEHLKHIDGVMFGRLACDNPYYLTEIHKALHPQTPILKRSELYVLYLDYLMNKHQEGIPLSLLIKPLFNLAHGQPGAKLWKQQLMLVLRTQNTALLEELKLFLLALE